MQDASLRGKSVNCKTKINKALGTFTTEEISMCVRIMNTWVKYLEEQKNSATVVGRGTERYARDVLRNRVNLPRICV